MQLHRFTLSTSTDELAEHLKARDSDNDNGDLMILDSLQIRTKLQPMFSPSLIPATMLSIAVLLVTAKADDSTLAATNSSQGTILPQTGHSFVPADYLCSNTYRVDANGILRYTLPLGQNIIFGGQSLPIVALFSPAIATGSEIGTGWRLPILDSNIIATDDGTMQMDFIDGRRFVFHKAPHDPNAYLDSEGRILSLAENTATLKDHEGFQFVYTGGHITRIDCPDGGQVDFSKDSAEDWVTYRGAAGSINLLRADIKDGLITQITTNDNVSTSIAYGKRPIIQQVNAVTVIGSLQDSIVGVKNDFYKLAIDFTPTSKIQPQMVVKDSRGKVIDSFLWSPGSNQLSAEETGGSIIHRQKGDLQMSNLESTVKTDMISTPGHATLTKNGQMVNDTFYFVSGPLTGKVRKQIKIVDNVSQKTSYSYDETGRLIRVHQEAGPSISDVAFTYSGSDPTQIEKTTISKNGTIFAYDSQYNLIGDENEKQNNQTK